MATLQAARAFALGLEEPRAKSWGLNRAIFYAAAKRGFKAKPPAEGSLGEIKKRPIEESADTFHLGSEMAYKVQGKDGKANFTIGGKVQTESEFQRQIESRFGGKFDEAWKEALELVKEFDREILLSQKDFFDLVYKPKRDELSAKWTEGLK
ncbi:MAG: hypothetical protein WED04_05395 [Promethearchaeati archaeon SRVP18_Atabeyarchaeia-1]